MKRQVAIIDGDILVYRICWTIDPNAEMYMVKNHCNTYIKTILDKVQCTDYIGLLGIHGSTNFKYSLFSEYKKGRPSAKPPHWNIVLNYLISEWRFVCISGCEVDDAIRYCVEHVPYDEECIIVSADKDLLQIPGKHFILGVTRKGKTIREDKITEITEQQGAVNFHRQLLTGDLVDNVKGVTGIGPKKAKNIIPDDIGSNDAMLAVYKEYKRIYAEEDVNHEFIKASLLLAVNSSYAENVGFERPKPINYKPSTEEIVGY